METFTAYMYRLLALFLFTLQGSDSLRRVTERGNTYSFRLEEGLSAPSGVSGAGR
jgi:hypothetical protein